MSEYAVDLIDQAVAQGRRPMRRHRTNCKYCQKPGRWHEHATGVTWVNLDGQEHRCIEYRRHIGMAE